MSLVIEHRVETPPHDAVLVREPSGALRMHSNLKLGNVAPNTGAWLERWAKQAPRRIALAERSGVGWMELTYGQTFEAVRAIAASLLARGLNHQTPIVILSGNGVNHALLSLAAQYIGVPVTPLAVQYSLIPEAHPRLIYVLDKVKPAMVFADHAGRYARALALPQFDGLTIVVNQTEGAPRPVIRFTELLKGDGSIDVDAAHAEVGPETLAKILFTSGSSSDPKGVLTTHGMMCANQAQLAAALPFLTSKPHRVLDWLPWNHVFGGSHNFNMMLANGGSFYIDDGKPTKIDFARSLENLRSRPGTLAFNVPVGYAMLVAEMRDDSALRRAFFKDLDLIFYAGASLLQDVWSALEDFAQAERGHVPLMTSCWGMTETAPACLMVHEPIRQSGIIGVPLPGVSVKLLSSDEGRCELRVKGPNVTTGYWKDPKKSTAAFDDEGYLMTGDAVRFLDETDPNRGLVFDGRVSEDFKLTTGTWVHAGKLRLEALAALRDLVQDVVICGHDRGEIGLFIFPKPDHVHGENTSEGAVIDPILQAEIEAELRVLAMAATGSAKRITRAIILAEPPSVKNHEITDKGSLNVRKIMTHRHDLLERLYDNDDPALIRV